MNVIETRGLAKRYGSHTVLSGIDLEVPRGSIYALLGPNGAGKTTTLRLLTGLARPSGGSVWIAGQDARRPQARRSLGALIESPALYPHLSGLDNLRVYAADLGATPARMHEVLEVVGLGAVAKRLVGRYSLGMRQRLGIALALLGDPQVLILDEPQNGLDPQGMRDMRTLLSELNGMGHTLMVSSHLLGEVQQLATHVGLMSGGCLTFQGEMAALLEQTRGLLRVEVDDAPTAARLLIALDPDVQVSGNTLTLRAEAALVARALVLGGVDLHRLEPDGPGLEERYFDLTGSGQGVRA
ncbi:ABC-2 type transport system ATP-binding protein [Deinobacterium chartae]|uniref:ABC-2 type transport system ATP-binding protein n=1 Tax=Deinobacterium chartae TaxID=521158 RepID=A0A841I0H7_9DEIO|nr:ATP-binding cassette domain-containing protein [Deinobacterium chartae]MBB6098474.1 ABC-2 type transport system ATP-binding protein [Deinobacterium chartae]